jgi:hypothetical protein
MPTPAPPSTLQLLVVTLSAALVSSIISPLIFHFLNRRRDRRQRGADRRIEDYRRYLRTLEGLSESLRNDFKDLLGVKLPQHFSRILNGQPDFEGFNADLGQLYSRVFSSSTQAKVEVQALKLTCSEEVFGLVNRYVALWDEVQRETSTISMTKNNLPAVAQRFTELASQSDALHSALIAQMRKEIGES